MNETIKKLTITYFPVEGVKTRTESFKGVDNWDFVNDGTYLYVSSPRIKSYRQVVTVFGIDIELEPEKKLGSVK